jgi:regulatory LuxR family protein
VVARGLTNAGIGRRLYISEATVKTDLLRLFGKLGVSDPDGRRHHRRRAGRPSPAPGLSWPARTLIAGLPSLPRALPLPALARQVPPGWQTVGSWRLRRGQ